jgi:hypothetical protein
MNDSSDIDPIIFRYTRAMAMADGVLVDAMQGELAEVSRQHFPRIHLAMTDTVLALLEAAVKTGAGHDYAGLWHDILWMARACPVSFLPNGRMFKVGIRASYGLQWHELKILFHPGDAGEPCATVMQPEED